MFEGLALRLNTQIFILQSIEALDEGHDTGICAVHCASHDNDPDLALERAKTLGLSNQQ